MKISSNTSWARAGKQMAEAIVETVHGLYLRDNALQYIQAMLKVLNEELERRKVDWGKNQERRKKEGLRKNTC